MDQKQIDRINELARKSRTPQGLTEWEQAEQAALRREYIDSVLGNLSAQLDLSLIHISRAGYWTWYCLSWCW